MAPLLRDVSLCVFPPKTSRVPLRSTAECKYRGKPLSLRMNLEHVHDRRVKDNCAKEICNSHGVTYSLECIMKQQEQRNCVDLPCPRVRVVSVEVIDKAVFVGGQSFIAAMNVDAATAAVIRAAVAVASLGNGTFGLRHQPRVGP